MSRIGIEVSAEDERLRKGEDIAVVGMACLLPGADTPGRFWENIVRKHDAISDAPPDWQPELFYGPEGPKHDRSYTKRGGFLGDLCRFNPLKYGVVPSSLEGAEPDHFIALRCAFEAFADAGYPRVNVNRERTGVIFGRGIFVNRGWVTLFQKLFAVDQVIRVLQLIEPRRSASDLELIRAELKKNLPPANAETFPGLVHNNLVGRIANRLDLMGPTYTLDAACSSTLLAVEHAVRELRSGRADAMLVGGSQVSIPGPIHIMFCHLEALSVAGKIAPFSAEAAGTVLGQGCGALLLKRRSDAERDGNRTYARIKAVGSSSDGKGAGLLAPRTEGQQLAIRRAYEDSGIDPRTIGLIEAHGTGIPLGDATEIASLRATFGPRAGADATIGLGSVKSMVGHLVPASGVASLIKTILALYHRTLPPTLHAERAQPGLGLETTPFFLVNETRPWIHGDRATPRRAGIDAFGFGGINAHAILEEHDTVEETALPRAELSWPAELVLLTATDRAGLLTRIAALRAFLDRGAERAGVTLLEVAAAAARERGGDATLAIVAKDPGDLARKLEHAARLLSEPGRDRIQDRQGLYFYARPMGREGRVAFVIPGEGSQYVHMLEELCRHFPEVRRHFDLTEAAFLEMGEGRSLGRLLFPQPGGDAAAEAELFRMDMAVAAVTAAARAFLDLLARFQVKADAVVGHSSGEFAALWAAGSFRPENDAELVRAIVSGTQSTARVAASDLVPQAVLTAIGGADPDAVAETVRRSVGRLVIALDNCPHQVVLAGDEASTARALEELRGRGGLCQRIPWDRPYHTETVAPICRFVAEYFDAFRLHRPAIEWWSCATAARFPDDPEAIRELCVRSWRTPVRFRETVEAMHAAGVRVFVEVGPRGNLSAFIDDTLTGRPHAAVPMDLHRRGGLEQLCHALGMLAAHGLPVAVEELFARRRPRPIDVAAAPPVIVRDPILRLDLPLFEVGAATRALWEQHRPPVLRPVPPPPPGDEAEPTPAAGDPAPVSAATGDLTAGSAATAAVPPTGPWADIPDARAAAVADFQRTMQQFLRLQEEMFPAADQQPYEPAPPSREAARPTASISPALRAAPATAVTPAEIIIAAPAPAPAAMARPILAAVPPAAEPVARARRSRFLETVLEHQPGWRLTAECELDAARHPFLLDHTFFGRGISEADPTLTPLPIVPLALTLELLAEAAAMLDPENRVIALGDMRVSRWLALDTPTRRVRVEAALESPGRIRATAYEGDTEGMKAEIASALIETAPAFPALGPARLAERSGAPPPWTPEEIYSRVLYHGPTYRGIDRVESWDRRFVRAAVSEPRPAHLGGAAGDLVLPVQLIDVASQIPGLANGNTASEGPTCALAFPNHIDRLEFVADRPSSGMTAVATVDEQDGKMTSDTEIRDADGRVLLRYLGKVEEVVRFPAGPYRYSFDHDGLFCSADLTPLFADAGTEGIAVRLAHPEGAGLLVHRFWSKVAAGIVLGRDERGRFEKLTLPPMSLAGWLLARMAAKDAVRALAGRDLKMADVAIVSAPNGAPRADIVSRAASTTHPVETPHVGLAHKGFVAVAAAAAAGVCDGIGIDVEPIGPLDPALAADAFTPEDRALLAVDAAGSAAETGEVAAWAAKEAIGKALGHGLPGGPRDLVLVGRDAASGTFACRTAGRLLREAPETAGRTFEAIVRTHDRHVIALSRIPRGSRTENKTA
ncbi:MAG TPA: beta-ketoacyl synthase N-terminal-like domain-containing protein [Verrucomicrobiae bacterium]|nr:beta-ketoacyl synthase N-terminal-like domain-containing protein [Verrucomicrobiae bacterium]